MESLDRLEKCFIETFNLADGTDIRTLEYRGIEAWDSLGHMQLVAVMEETFDIMLDTEDIIDMSSFREIVRILQKYGVEFA